MPLLKVRRRGLAIRDKSEDLLTELMDLLPQKAAIKIRPVVWLFFDACFYELIKQALFV